MIRLKIKEVAEEKGFNMSSLARKSDLGFSTIKRIWKDPYKNIDLKMLEKIAKALDVSPLGLIEDIPDEAKASNSE